MYRNLIVTEEREFTGCTPLKDGLKMRVVSSMTVKELRDRFGYFYACINGQAVVLGSHDRVEEIVAKQENLHIIFQTPTEKK